MQEWYLGWEKVSVRGRYKYTVELLSNEETLEMTLNRTPFPAPSIYHSCSTSEMRTPH